MIATVEESDEVSALTRSTPSSSSATALRGGPSPPDERTSSPTLHDRSTMMAPQNAHGNRGLVVLLMEGLPKGDATPEVRAKFRQELEAVLRHDDVGALAPGATLAASAPLVCPLLASWSYGRCGGGRLLQQVYNIVQLAAL